MKPSKVRNVGAVGIAWLAALVAMAVSFFFLYSYANAADANPASGGFLLGGLSAIHLGLGLFGALAAGPLWKGGAIGLACWAAAPYLPLFGMFVSRNPLFGMLPGLIFGGGIFGIYFVAARLFDARRRKILDFNG